MPENWIKIKDLFYEALRRESSERLAFLDDACSGDLALRSEVETLLRSLNEARTFLERPAMADISGEIEWQLANGSTVSHYTIVEPIGSGGMGEVYLAEDTRLGRRVALKVLPSEMADDQHRLRRFEREARAVSALNHPNILTIFDFETAGDVRFFASEFVSGSTLRDRLDKAAIGTAECLDISIQIVSALRAAHDAGVVHRDIKPENVMIRDDGYVKVLDFGLAKVAPAITAETLRSFSTQRFSLPGVVMGTVAYMSPEQARGANVDARTDIFSFGVVLYEMLSGEPPFRGETPADILAQVLQSEPGPLISGDKAVTPELGEIVKRCLAKDASDRFQNAAELLASLKTIANRLQFGHASAAEGNGRAGAGRKHLSRSSKDSSERIRRFLPDLSPLVGRSHEIDVLAELISKGSRLITLTGIGGTGKTRLAQEMCVRLDHEFADGFIFARLADVHDAGVVPDVIAQQARVQEIVGKPIKETLIEFLRDRQMLVVLDNFEQIMDAASFVGEMLAAADKITVLVTSRERLHLNAEVEFIVPTLPVPEDDCDDCVADLANFDSVRLFIERARRSDPDFELNENNALQIARICSMLDGLPLAIELAAARARILSPAAILEKLKERLSFLTGGARDLPERQQTMRAAVDWSYDLLNEEEKRLFRRLSVFSCRFTLAAAEEVAWAHTPENRDADFLDIFTSLADKSLLVRRKDVRGDTVYCLLEIVREYAQRALERDDDADVVLRRYTMYYLALAEEGEPHLRGRDSAFWIGRLDEEHDNLTGALSWSMEKDVPVAARLAAAIRHYWLTRGHFSEGLRWCESILERAPDISAETRWKLLTACGNISQFQGQRDRAEEFYQDALAAARLSGNEAYIAQSLRGLGAMRYIKLDLGTARELINEAIDISRRTGDDFGLAASLARLGDISSVEGDLSAGRELTTRSLSIFRRLGYLEGISAKLYNLGAVLFLDGDKELAAKCFEEAYEVAREIGEKINTRLIFDGFAAIAAEAGEHVLAAKLSGVAQGLGATIGYSIEPAEQRFRDSYLDRLRSVIGDDEFETYHKAGQLLSPREARELVLAARIGRG